MSESRDPIRDGRRVDERKGTRLLGALAILVAGVLATLPARSSAEEMSAESAADAFPRDFDFWIGEWTVNNRFLGPDGTWHDRGEARATIVPILDGRGLVERWVGTTNGNKTIGFSLRSWDPVDECWRILLNWPGGGQPSFSVMKGGFRHGRGEFFGGYTDAQGTRIQSRFTFSDAQPNSCRWDSATSRDGGETWRTSWIMEFTRVRAASEVSADELFTPTDEPNSCVAPEGSQFDFLPGTWTAKTASGEYRLRAAKILEQCMIVSMLEYIGADGDSWRRFTVRAFTPRSRRWEAWSMDERDRRWTKASGSVGRSRAVLEPVRNPSGAPAAEAPSAGDAGSPLRRETFEAFRDGDSFVYREERLGPDGAADSVIEAVFRRQSP